MEPETPCASAVFGCSPYKIISAQSALCRAVTRALLLTSSSRSASNQCPYSCDIWSYSVYDLYNAPSDLFYSVNRILD